VKIAIASGKGGTGKTTIAVNLASVMDGPVTYIDCDVEEPNGHIFLKPVIDQSREVGIRVPVVDNNICTGCSRCVDVCRYNALACVTGKVLVFSELCHGCGGCMLACPVRAITETDHVIGVVEKGCAGDIAFVQGRLNVGAAMSPPLIRAVKDSIPARGITILDAPPGTSCPAIAAVRDSDIVVLVTEPTPFGLHDLMLAAETIKELNVPFGVVINRCDIGDQRVTDFCQASAIPILLEIPENRRIAEAYSRGEIAVTAVPETRDLFRNLAERLLYDVDRVLAREGAGT